MNLDQIKEKLKELLTEKRYVHSLNVAESAKKLAEIYGADEEKAYLAGVVHDCAKYFKTDKVDYYVAKYNIELDELEVGNISLSHSIIGSYVVKYDFGIDDDDIISSVRYHTTGRENMSILEKIIFMADMIEEGRNNICCRFNRGRKRLSRSRRIKRFSLWRRYGCCHDTII